MDNNTPTAINWLGNVIIPATAEKFISKEKFSEESEEVKFYGIWTYFTAWFLSGDGKIEESFNEHMLHFGSFIQPPFDSLIVKYLGGEARVETTLSDVWYLLKMQASGEHGFLLTNGDANIFYVRDIRGLLRVVGIRWGAGGWSVGAKPLKGLAVGDLFIGRRLFSHNHFSV